MTTRKELVQAVLQASETEGDVKRIECARALGVAKKNKVKPIDIGAICNELEIKIIDCQLGCFGGKTR
jgi:hypothetical protein